MAGGPNDKRSSTTNNRGDHHHIVNISTSTPSASSSQPCPVTSTSANPVVQFSGTVESFNNYENGSQDFSDATISSSRTGASFNNLRSGTQTFRAAEIRCVDDKRSASVLPWKRDHVSGGILHSFNNNANGSQKLDGANINLGAGHKV